MGGEPSSVTRLSRLRNVKVVLRTMDVIVSVTERISKVVSYGKGSIKG